MKSLIKQRLREEFLNEDWKSNLRTGLVGGALALSSLAGGGVKAQDNKQNDKTQSTQSTQSSDFDRNTLDSISTMLNNNPGLTNISDLKKLQTIKDGRVELTGGIPSHVKGNLVDLQDISFKKENGRIIDITILVMTVKTKTETIDIDYVKTFDKFNVVAISPIDTPNNKPGYEKINLLDYVEQNKMAGYKINDKLVSNKSILSQHYIYVKKMTPKEGNELLQSLGDSFKIK